MWQSGFNKFALMKATDAWSESEHRLGVISFGLWGFGVFFLSM
jgi:hypothetical protein